MTRKSEYQDLKGRKFDLDELDADEQQLVSDLRQFTRTNPDWNAFDAHWLQAVAAFYDRRGLSRRESRQTAVYRIAQDLSGRLAIAAGLARAPEYRDELEELVRTQFGTRREFCRATGLAEDMVSHVLARRKHLAVDTLSDALHRIGYTLRIVPVAVNGAATNGHK